MADVVLRYAQMGIEVTPGTAVPATRKIPCIVKPEPILNYYEPEVQRGDYVSNYVVAPQGKMVNMNLDTQLYLDDVACYFNQVMYGATASAVDAGIVASAPTVTNVGTTGATTATYYIVVELSTGDTAASAAGTTTTGNASLNGTNYNHIVITPVTGAIRYKILKGGTSGVVLLATLDSSITTYDDQGGALATFTRVGSTSGQSWSWLGAGAVANRKTGTLEWYDGAQGWQANYLVWKNLKISGEADKEVKINMTGFGRAWTTATPTAALTQQYALPIQSWSKKLYVSAAGAAPTDLVSNGVITKFDWEFDNSASPIWAGNNNQNFTYVGFKKMMPKMTIGCLFDGSFEWTQFDGSTRRSIMVELVGPNISTMTQRLQLSMHGPWRAFKLDEYEGASYVELDLLPEFNSSVGYDWKVNVINGVPSY